MKYVFVKALVLSTLAFGAFSTAQAATTFAGTTTVSANNSPNGLEIEVADLVPLNFTLDVGQSFSGNVFTLYTLETSVDWDDLFPQSITATFNFTLPEVFGGSVPGNTYGQSLIGIVQQGVVSWNNSGNASLAFGGGGLLNVHLEDGIFNSGFFGVDEGLGEGAHINGQFTLVSAPVPEPATWAMMISGFGLVGGALRRRHSKRLLVTA